MENFIGLLDDILNVDESLLNEARDRLEQFKVENQNDPEKFDEIKRLSEEFETMEKLFLSLRSGFLKNFKND